MRIHVVGGFLGAGKTTLIRALAAHLVARGEQVAVVTNDQGHALVDTRLCAAEIPDVAEIAGGCVCCNYDDLESTLITAESHGATVAVVEAVGSCTDLIATVQSPLAYGEANSTFDLAPLAVVVDPWRIQQLEDVGPHDGSALSGGVHRDVAFQQDVALKQDFAFQQDVTYLIRKQIQEADVILVSRSDLDPPDVRDVLKQLAPGAAIVDVSGRTGDGIEDWLDARPERPAAPLEIDYSRYAAAEALLGWSNGEVQLRFSGGFDPARVMRDFLLDFTNTNVAHVKLVSIDPAGGSGSLVRRGSEPVMDAAELPSEVTSARLLVNARIAMPPAELEQRVRGAMKNALPDGTQDWKQWECFAPSPPEPTHRHAFRCGTGDDASCCAAFYDRADVRYLLGDSLHPGGIDLTLQMAQHLRLGDGQHILDVACGQATSLKAIRQAWPVATTGLDAGIVRPGSGLGPVPRPVPRPGPDPAQQTKGTNGAGGIDFYHGDAHKIPFDDGHFDAVLCECALSTFADQALALSEMRRVLKTGGRLALSDMVVDGMVLDDEVPESLHDWVNVGTCLAGALTFDGYKRAIEDAGFRIVEHWNASNALTEMMGRIKRNLLGFALAKASGNLPDDVNLDVPEGRRLLRDAQQAIQNGVIGYGVYIAECI